MSASVVLLPAACAFLALGVPVAFALGLATITALLVSGQFPLLAMLKETFTGIDSFPLMAVPFFILAAELMSGGSLTRVLLRFAGQFVGHKRGGLGYTNVVSLTFFSGISGSALADAAGPGAMMIEMMDEAGYDRSYAAALTASTAIVGPIIPPSIIMIIYALADDNVSVGALFAAGIVPGLLVAAAMSLVNWHVSRRRNYRPAAHPSPARPPRSSAARARCRASDVARAAPWSWSRGSRRRDRCVPSRRGSDRSTRGCLRCARAEAGCAAPPRPGGRRGPRETSLR
jgi:tripartite ATP-independent transporter DctM subunit